MRVELEALGELGQRGIAFQRGECDLGLEGGGVIPTGTTWHEGPGEVSERFLGKPACLPSVLSEEPGPLLTMRAHLTLYHGIECMLLCMKVPLRIGAVAEAAGVGVQTLRYYERRGLLSARRRTAGGYREYAPDAVRRVVFIRRAQAMGFTLDEIGALLALRVREPRGCEPVKKSAEIAHARVHEQLTALRRMDKVLARLIRACDARAVTEACPILEALEPEKRS